MSEASGVSPGLSLETQLLCRTCDRLLDLDSRTNCLAGKGYLPKSLSLAYSDAVNKIPEAMQNVITSQLCSSGGSTRMREVRENAPSRQDDIDKHGREGRRDEQREERREDRREDREGYGGYEGHRYDADHTHNNRDMMHGDSSNAAASRSASNGAGSSGGATSSSLPRASSTPSLQGGSGASTGWASQNPPSTPPMPVVDRSEAIVWIAAVTRLAREVSSAESKQTYSRSKAAWGILTYQVIALVAAVFGFIWLNQHHVLNVSLIPDVAVDNIFWGALAGLIGAVTYALFGLYSHMIHRTLDRDHLLWYIVKPLTGAILGSFVSNAVIVLLNGLTGHSLSLTGADAVSGSANAASAAASSGAGASIIPALTFLLVAFFAGYSERFTSSIMETFALRITGTDPSPELDASTAVASKLSQGASAGAGSGGGSGSGNGPC